MTSPNTAPPSADGAPAAGEAPASPAPAPVLALRDIGWTVGGAT
ncbi:ABC transporter ATP-binding protein, partial [Streptomyces sp. SID89]|nr:ABC transporter ATP-binding protein [Streptomyces sp. SID89]